MSSIGQNVRSTVEQVMRDGQVPGMVLAIARGDRPAVVLVVGEDARGRPLGRDTLFPVASVTKLATALAVLRLADQGGLTLDDQLSEHLPEAVAAQHGVTIRTLLSHTSGLPVDVAPSLAAYAPGLDWPKLCAACLETPLEEPAGTRVQYDNVGYGLLAAVVEWRTNQGFTDALRELVLDPLGVEGYLGDEPPREAATLADVRGAHRGGELEPFNSAFWRSLALPWAGLLTTAEGALALVRAFQGYPAGFLQPSTQAEAIRDQTGGLAGGLARPLYWTPCPWGLGPDILGHKTPHWAPAEAGPDSFGHSGASGCLAWATPADGVAWAMLGARTADSGWLLRRAPAIGAAIVTETAENEQ
ncbi:MAG TPA: serine hydrolase domain-containing protein [Roseiflexaceae bacterium]|nr:serine hydrolase domain-containing protein [Roseiflexaceae bacterium]